MNKKAELFKKYLDEKGITCFQVDEIAGDSLNTVVFRSHIDVEGQSLPVLLILDSSIYGIVRVLVSHQAIKDDNVNELYKSVNALNKKYKSFKYYFDDEGSLVLDSCIMMRVGEVDGNLIYTVFDVLIKHLQEEYRPLMKVIWK